MSFHDALNRARLHSAIVQRMEFALQSDPSNERRVLGLGSARRRAARSEEQMETMAGRSSIDIVRYRMVRDTEVYAVEAVAESVNAFQKSFTGAADFLKSGPKAKAKYSKDIEAQTRLNLAYTYPGSLGLVLAVEHDRDMFDMTEFDKIADVFGQFLNVETETDAVDASRSLGSALITSLCKWVDVNAEWGNSVDFVFKRPDGVQRGEFVAKNKFVDLSDIFHSAKDEEPSDFDVAGMLVGLDIELGNFHFVVPDGASYKGKLGANFNKEPTVVGQSFVASISEKIARNVATGHEHHSYTLQTLRAVRGA
jgi:hypothetical protein